MQGVTEHGKCPDCGWKQTGHGWQDHACWCPKTWAWVYRKDVQPNAEDQQTLTKEKA